MATPEHCLYCFESLASTLENRKSLSLADVQASYAAYLAQRADTAPPPGAAATKATDPDARYPLFVTWDARVPAGAAAYRLRGCIGTFRADARLAAALAEYARAAALRDDRFRPVARAELPALRCAVTLLTDFESCAGPRDWVVGEHGIHIKFGGDGAGAPAYAATYLPSVALEQGWSQDETLLSLMRKAGWEGPRETWRDVAEGGGMEVVRYRGDKVEVEYAQFKAWRDWVSANWKQGD